MKNEDITKGEHWWCEVNGDLLVVIKDGEYDYYAAGCWECSYAFEELNFIALIEKPKGYEGAVCVYDSTAQFNLLSGI